MKHRLLIATLLLSPLFSQVALATPEQLKSIEASQGAQKAYEYGLTIEDQYAGDPTFDWLFAQIALNTNHADVAIFVLERIVILNPNDQAARLELARAYYLTGDYDNAFSQFKTIETENPSPEVIANIERYLKIMQEQGNKAPLKPSVKGSLGLQMGYDTNINSATNDNSIGLPNVGNVLLNSSATKQKDSYAQLQGGLLGEHPLSSTSKVFAQADTYYEWHQHYDEFNLGNINTQLGFELDRDKHTIKAPVVYERTYLEGSGYSHYYGVMPLWTYRANTQLHYTGFIQAGGYRYDDISSQDTNLVLGSGGVTYKLKELPLTLASSVFYGQEFAQNSGNSHVDKDLYGTQAGLQWVVKPRHIMYTTALWQKSPYGGTDPVFLVTREDTYMTGSVGWYWQKTATLSLQLEVDYLQNDSNISLYEYDRWITFVQVRKEFG